MADAEDDDFVRAVIDQVVDDKRTAASPACEHLKYAATGQGAGTATGPGGLRKCRPARAQPQTDFVRPDNRRWRRCCGSLAVRTAASWTEAAERRLDLGLAGKFTTLGFGQP